MYERESMDTDNFKTTHLIVFGTNIYKKEDDGKNKYMIQKTDLINFIYNYLNTATMIFKINEINKDSNLNDIVKKNNDLINDKINKYINISPDIRANYELINNNLVIGEYFRYNNFFFNKVINYDEKNDSFGKILINFDFDSKFKIFIDKTGIKYNIKKENKINDEIKNKFISPKSQSLSLNYNEFFYIYFYFENN